jgi:hypothetical protein
MDLFGEWRKLSLVHVEHEPSAPTRLPGSTGGEYATSGDDFWPARL